MKVFGGVLVLRGVAAADMSANQAHSQMDPGVAHPYAVLTLVRLGLAKLDLIKVSTFFGHPLPPRVQQAG
jgi:hypothetical protein